MPAMAHWEPVLVRLEEFRAVLLGQVAEELTFSVPLLSIPPQAADPAGYHQRQMVATAARLHDSLQSARLDEQLLVYEFVWAAQVLPRWGVCVEDFEQLVDAYLSSAEQLGTWKDAERVVLEEMRGYLLRLTVTTFSLSEGSG
jgi:hypothetical protein